MGPRGEKGWRKVDSSQLWTFGESWGRVMTRTSSVMPMEESLTVAGEGVGVVLFCWWRVRHAVGAVVRARSARETVSASRFDWLVVGWCLVCGGFIGCRLRFVDRGR